MQDYTPLMHACKNNNLKLAKLLVSFGANVKTENEEVSKHALHCILVTAFMLLCSACIPVQAEQMTVELCSSCEQLSVGRQASVRMRFTIHLNLQLVMMLQGVTAEDVATMFAQDEVADWLASL